MDESSSPSCPITLVLILSLSSQVKSPSNIHLSIFPHSGSSLKRWSLSKIMMAFIILCQNMNDILKNIRSDSFEQMSSSWRKSPAKIIDNPLKDVILFPMSMSLLLSAIRILSFMNETSSITRISTSFHSFNVICTQLFLLIDVGSFWNCYSAN